ncbi:MAG: transcription termination/antitermination protein NusG [Clostridia bacterium]|nr:transcription termination/antitermination protein NusG [Clostridia bacterium]
MSEAAKWYVVHTYSGYENKVAATIQKTVENRHLEDLIFDVRVPTEIVTEVRETGTKEVERKIFPGYVLIKMIMNDDSWYVVRNTRGVTSFVGPGSKPVPLTEQEVAALGMEKLEVKLSYQVGDSVKVIDGPLEGFIGVVDEIDLTNQTVKVTVSMFGRGTPAELRFGQVAALEATNK